MITASTRHKCLCAHLAFVFNFFQTQWYSQAVIKWKITKSSTNQRVYHRKSKKKTRSYLFILNTLFVCLFVGSSIRISILFHFYCYFYCPFHWRYYNVWFVGSFIFKQSQPTNDVTYTVGKKKIKNFANKFCNKGIQYTLKVKSPWSSW